MTSGYQSFFKDKVVTQLGLGLLGRGVGDAAFLARHCRKVHVTDLKSAEELERSVAALGDYDNIEFHLGGHPDEIFSGVDFVMKGAGVRLDNPYVARARANGIAVYMSSALFARFADIPLIGVTGTRGKTTTTCMIADILKRAGKKVLLGGNIRGVSTLAQLPEVEGYDCAVLELDSWQLQGFDELKISPNIGVFTNLYPDHMNYYDGDMRLYLRDKAAIFRHHRPGDVLIATAQASYHTAEERQDRDPESPWIVAPALGADVALQVPGAHNLSNAALAKAAALAFGVEAEAADAALRDFSGVEGRLQLAGAWQGRVFYNDSNSTTQEATMAALTSFPSASVVLIFGGADKGLPLDRVLAYIAEHKIRCVLIKGTGSDRILQQMPDLQVVGSMTDAVRKAVEMSKPRDNILLSPAMASFGVFKNEYDRSDQFMGEVRALMASPLP